MKKSYISGASPVCVLASDRPWNWAMLERLQAKSKYDFILVSDPRDLTFKKLASINPRFIFFPHWSVKINRDIYEKFECVIFHMTDLPFGRGGSPLQNLIVRGITDTKVSAIRCIEEVDAGPIYLKKSLSLHGAAEEIFLRASKLIEEMIIEIIKDNPKPVLQKGKSTTFRRRKPADGSLEGAQTLERVFDLIRMLDADGYPHAFVDVGPFRIELTRSSLKLGQVLADAKISYRNDNKES
jgi:methionyl-tRNA formyltransferase